ncbi:effector-associated constant component EACC1 [Nonomuraea sp. CA-141351]|uniref:effector-associated constant component EACC1 n=1 Tax=Nonomuraea sp. CA-141351 TaxID=3239996 RepID=UPI003D8A64BB
MSINIRIDGEYAEQELRSLYDWLRNEPNIRQHAEIRLLSKELNPNEMGDTLDLISLIITSSLQLPTLADVVLGWMATRRRRPTVTIERGEMRVEVSGANMEEVVKILNAMGSHD